MMITISTNKGLTRVENWEEIQTRPGFLPDLNPADHEFDSIIGRYIFPEKIRCGLSNCHTPHTRGFIVSTKSGRETNIGKDCGKTYFGVDFELQARKFDRDIAESENRDLLWNFSFQLDEFEKKLRLCARATAAPTGCTRTSRSSRTPAGFRQRSSGV